MIVLGFILIIAVVVILLPIEGYGKRETDTGTSNIHARKLRENCY